ncbi:hypothetical protein SDC9_144646 [bioreactor metagenome]|jgi:hypothetical protein|uniref:Uncharacterized protein n=1 Tax=bioreactor metagenome TaxID=1076179 RepID=A0A645E9H8_9ZZZZ
MSILFKNEFVANYHANVVGGLSSLEHRFCYPGATKGGRVNGIGIEFYSDGGEAWFGSFAEGDISPNAVSFAGTTPALSKALVIAKGEGYLVDVGNPEDWFELTVRPVMGVLCLPHFDSILAWDFVRMICVDSKGIRWRTPSISWDGIKDVVLDNNDIVAKVWDAPTSTFQTARIAIADGTVNGGSSPELVTLRPRGQSVGDPPAG